ncbi:hypothetical protein [Nocardiopsis valliformis]|uniref:hypothetical protein n=1 Tax=Nocardiopsis valliformis TaxID=239974 RepID=UPI000369EDAB|nr:hypothetical protein [Nocardiopsis valliformis]
MESTLTHPSSTSETPNPSGFSPPRKRPQGALKGIGFILPVWVVRIFSQGHLPTLRSLAALMAIANAVDADGRWCFFFLENLAQRCGKLSVSSLKRGIDDLAEAGIVRKLTRSEAIEFFAEDIKRGRSPYRLPCVLELLVPAEDYSELVLEEINACRAQLGEEPLTAHNRPPLTRRPTPVQIERGPSSDRPTDCFPGDLSDTEVDGSVRGTSRTGEQTQQKPQNGLFGIIDRIQNKCLADPVADRERLAQAVDKLLRQGLSEADARALLSGLDSLRRPFPALMWRLRHMEAACDYLNGSLGRGIHGSNLPTPSWPVPGEDGDPFGRPEQFPVDSAGKAAGTCPEHHGTRNFPGGNCVICGRLCRSVPGELMHEPEPGDAGLPAEVPGLEAVRLFPAEEAALDPELLGAMGDSLNRAGRAHTFEPVPRNGHRASSGRALTAKAQRWVDRAREQLEKARMCGTRWDPIG